MRICQLQNLARSIFITILLVSCSTPKIIENNDDRTINASWFKIPFKFGMRDQNDNYLTHPFFDIDPRFKKEQRTINYFTTTPVESLFKYDLDLYSGKLYKERQYCAVDDIWDFYSADVFKPNFVQGIIPRAYDQNSKPQKIIVFSSSSESEKFSHHPLNYDTAKIVGSVLLESCENYPCNSKEKWASTQILVAVNSKDPDYARINFLHELKNKVNWVYVKSVLVNQDGVHQVGKKNYPAFRITKEFNLDETLKYYEANSKAVDVAELSKWRDSCFQLYDDIWEKTEKIRSEKTGQQTKFYQYFKDFYAKNSAQFYACQKLVRVANINDDVRRVWFFSYLQAFANLEKNGFYFNCTEKSWLYNSKVDDTHFANDQIRELEKCKPAVFEKSFDLAINGLNVMKNQINRNFRFIEYDTQRGGSHQKIYSWVLDSGKASACKKQISANQEIASELFPQDVVWQSFAPDDELLIK